MGDASQRLHTTVLVRILEESVYLYVYGAGSFMRTNDTDLRRKQTSCTSVDETFLVPKTREVFWQDLTLELQTLRHGDILFHS